MKTKIFLIITAIFIAAVSSACSSPNGLSRKSSLPLSETSTDSSSIRPYVHEKSKINNITTEDCLVKNGIMPPHYFKSYSDPVDALVLLKSELYHTRSDYFGLIDSNLSNASIGSKILIRVAQERSESLLKDDIKNLLLLHSSQSEADSILSRIEFRKVPSTQSVSSLCEVFSDILTRNSDTSNSTLVGVNLDEISGNLAVTVTTEPAKHEIEMKHESAVSVSIGSHGGLL